MEEAQRIFDYLPASPTDPEYIQFLWGAFESNYQNEKYQFGFIAYHMLFMCFIYYQIAKIYKMAPERCRDLMIFTGKVHDHINTHESKLNSGQDSSIKPLVGFAAESESTIMGLFLAIQCTRDEIKKMKTIVDNRNKVAHSNGNIIYRNKENLDDKINEMISCLEIIQTKSQSVIEQGYQNFLMKNSDQNDREFWDDSEQIKEIFIHKNYLSLEDIKIAQNWDISGLSSEANYPAILSLAQTLKKEYEE